MTGRGSRDKKRSQVMLGLTAVALLLLTLIVASDIAFANGCSGCDDKTITVFKFEDKNNNAKPDPGEGPLNGWEFKLYRCNWWVCLFGNCSCWGSWELKATRTTGPPYADGIAEFGDWPKNDHYRIEETTQTGWICTTGWRQEFKLTGNKTVKFGNQASCTSPSITTHPISQCACVDTSVTFSVNASGTPAPTYQWRRNGTNLSNGGNISGADTSSLTINPVGASDAGSYDCVATNSCGSATSNTAILTVNTALTPPANGSKTVACLADATDPGAPDDITDVCGQTVSAVWVSTVDTPDPLTCEGKRVYTYRYTACDGTTTADWTYTYTIDYSGALTPPTNGSKTVACLADATDPGAPDDIKDACDRALSAFWVSTVDTPDPLTCEGKRVYTYRYTACDGTTTADWTYTYTIDYSGALTPPTNGSKTVACLADATDPGAPDDIKDACDRAVSAVWVSTVDTPDPLTCEGKRVYTYRYTACDGTTTADWTYTYTIDYSGALTPPTNGSKTVACLADATDPGAPDDIKDACDRAVSAVWVSTVDTPDPLTCEGKRVYTYRYTACDGTTTADWTYTYTIDYSGALTPPANGSKTVACLADATDPGAPDDIKDACDRAVSAVWVSTVDTPDPLTCEGKRVYTYRYTACDGTTTADWTYTYTIDYSGALTPPTNGSKTVACLADATDPGAPDDIKDACDRAVSAVWVSTVDTPDPLTCEGKRVYTYRYTACDGTTTADWTYTYTIDYSGALTPPANGSKTVACLADATDPGAPDDIKDACDRAVSAVWVSTVDTPDPLTCEGKRVYTYRYTACDGTTTADWTYTYTIDYSGALTPPTNGSKTVACLADATDPGAPDDIKDACDRAVSAVWVSTVDTPDPLTCEGKRVYTYRYTACDGTTTADWTYTYTIDYSGALTPPTNGSKTVACLADATDPGAPDDIKDACDRAVSAVWVSTVDTPDPLTCEGKRVYTYRYTACDGTTTADWTYTYTIDYSGALTPPTNGSKTVACLADATDPGAPDDIKDACDRAVSAVWVSTVDTPDPLTCEGKRVYTYRYTACDGTTTADWTYTYTIDYSGALTPPTNGSKTVACLADATDPGAPDDIKDACDRAVSAVWVSTVDTPDPLTCEGKRVYTYRYTACDGTTTADWTYTYTIDYSGALTPPTNGSKTVACLADATDPGAPDDIKDACDRAVSAVWVSTVDTPDPLTCEGKRVYTYRYTACDGTTTADWTYTYTIDYSGALTPPTNGSKTVACLADATDPGAPDDIKDACDRAVSAVWVSTVDTPDPLTCEGKRVYTYRYTACDGTTTADWTYTYTIDYSGALTPPTNGSKTVACLADATDPGAPDDIKDACDRAVSAVWVSTVDTPDPLTCEGKRVYTYRYTACDGTTTADWTYTYTIDYSGALTPPTNGSKTVACLADATDPGAPDDIKDACDRAVSAVWVSTVDTPDPLTCEGKRVYTYRYTACDGTTTADWTYTYTIDYSGALTPPTNGSKTVACLADATDPGAPDDIKDACDRAVSAVWVSTVDTPDPLTCEGKRVYTYRYTACDGTTTADWTYTYTIDYSGALTPPANGSKTVACLADATDPGAPDDIKDACDRAVSAVWVSTVDTPDPLTCEGKRVYTYRYTACDGTTTADWTYTYTVERTVPPSEVGGPVSTSSTVECAAAATEPTTLPEVEDVCGTKLSAPEPVKGGTYDGCEGTITYKYTYEDCAGLQFVWTYTYEVSDTTPPTFTRPADITIYRDADCVYDDSVGATGDVTDEDDNCGVGEATFADSVNDSDPCNVIITRAWSLVDDCGNAAADQVQTITVEDNTPPIISTPASDETVECDGTGNTAELNAWLAGNGGVAASDNCSGVTWSNDFTALSDLCGATGAATVTFTATDDCDNSSSTTATFTIEDTTDPEIITDASNLTVECDGAGNTVELNAWLTSHGGAAASDNCSAVTWSDDFTALSDLCGATGSATVTFTATDDCGNSSSTTATFTIEDTTDPEIITDASNLTVECDGAGNTVELNAWLADNGGAVASDNCSGVTWSDDFTALSDLCGATGGATVTFTATDDCGNSSSTTATFTIEDTTDPEIITDASNLTVECDGAGNTVELNAWLADNGGAAASDNCCGDDVTWTHDFTGLSDDCGATGSATVTFTAEDCCGLTNTTSATFTIEDTTPPVIDTEASDETVECDGAGNTDALNAWLDSHGGAAASDDCSGVTWSNDFTALSDLCGATGAATVTFTATDDCGNSASTTTTFTIEDTTQPSITCPPDVTTCSDVGFDYAAGVAVGTASAGDTCDESPVVTGVRSDGNALADPYPVGTTTITWTAEDACGNSAFCAQTITVNASPGASIAPDGLVELYSVVALHGNPTGGSGTYVSHVWGEPGAVYLSDTTIENPMFSADAVGRHSLIYTVTDSNGCVGSSDAIVVEVINTAPGNRFQPLTTCKNTALAIVLTTTDPQIDPLDPTLHPLTFDINSAPTQGGISGDLTAVTYASPHTASVTVTYTPDTDSVGTDTFSFMVTDPFGASAIITITVTVEECEEVAGAGGGVFAEVVINEVGWAGTEASTQDEWIELRNNTDQPVDLTGWHLRWRRKQPATPEEELWKAVDLSGTLAPNGYYLLERLHEETVSDIEADLLYDLVPPYPLELRDLGEVIELLDSEGSVVDTANADTPERDGWIAGTGPDGFFPFGTMERIDPFSPDTDENWATNRHLIINGLDAVVEELTATAATINENTLIRTLAGETPQVVQSGEQITIAVDYPLGAAEVEVILAKLDPAVGGGGALVEPSVQQEALSGRRIAVVYRLSLDTSALTPGLYGLWLNMGDGVLHHFLFEIVDE